MTQLPRRIFRSAAAILGLVLVLLWFLISAPSSRGFLPLGQNRSGHNSPQDDDPCGRGTSAVNALVIVKTTAGVVNDTLPAQLDTSLRCAGHVLVFSDLEHTLGEGPSQVQVHDIVGDIPDEIKKNNPDLEYYHKLQEYYQNGRDIKGLSGSSASLDRYKSVPMLSKAWAMRPDHDWYVFIEGDTYVIWQNLMLWLRRLDASKSLYLGSVGPGSRENEGKAIVHGGGGVILSRAAMSKLLDGDSDITTRYAELARVGGYSGDYLLMKAMEEKNVPFRDSWPMLQAETMNTIPFGPGGDRKRTMQWCQPLVTLRAQVEDMYRVWEYERRMDYTNPILIGDTFDSFIGMNLTSERDEWDNLSGDLLFGVHGTIRTDEMTTLQKKAHQSFESCQKACDEHPHCYQYVYYNQTCGFSFSYRLGQKRSDSGNDGIRYRSGWDLARIGRSQADMPCITPQWI